MSDELVKRLRGEYRVPIKDGLGAVGSGEEPNNPTHFVRKFETPPIQHEAANRIEELERTIAALQPRPIETAPRDGTVVLLWHARDGAYVSGYWHTEPTIDNPLRGYEPGWSWWVAVNDIVMWDDGTEPTHWLPQVSP